MVVDYNFIVPLILLFKYDFDSGSSISLFLGSKWIDDKLVDELLGFGLFRSSSFFVFFECSSYSKACLLKFFGAFGLNPLNLQLIKVLHLFFKDSWRNFGRALMLGELILNDLGSASISSGLMKKSPLATSLFE